MTLRSGTVVYGASAQSMKMQVVFLDIMGGFLMDANLAVKLILFVGEAPMQRMNDEMKTCQKLLSNQSHKPFATSMDGHIRPS